MVGATGTCELHLASVGNSDNDRAVGIQYDLNFNPAEATMDSISCLPGDCNGLSGALATGHSVMLNPPATIAETGTAINIIFNFGGSFFFNDAVYQNGTFSGETYLLTYHFTLLSDGPVNVNMSNVVFANIENPPQDLNWEFIDGVLVTSEINP
jgi:hypothetical protein